MRSCICMRELIIFNYWETIFVIDMVVTFKFSLYIIIPNFLFYLWQSINYIVLLLGEFTYPKHAHEYYVRLHIKAYVRAQILKGFF